MTWLVIGLGGCIGVYFLYLRARRRAPHVVEKYPATSMRHEAPAHSGASQKADRIAYLYDKYRVRPPLHKVESAREYDYAISYADADGIVTDRNVTVLSVYINGPVLYLRSMCHLRGAERTFRADRILDCRHTASGEIISDNEAHFANFLIIANRPDPAHASVMARARHGLSALVWIARADRDVSTDEMEILLTYIGERNAIGGARFASVAWSRDKAAAQIDAMRPTLGDSLSGVARMSPTGKDYALLKLTAARLVVSGGVASERRLRQLVKQ